MTLLQAESMSRLVDFLNKIGAISARIEIAYVDAMNKRWGH